MAAAISRTGRTHRTECLFWADAVDDAEEIEKFPFRFREESEKPGNNLSLRHISVEMDEGMKPNFVADLLLKLAAGIFGNPDFEMYRVYFDDGAFVEQFR